MQLHIQTKHSWSSPLVFGKRAINPMGLMSSMQSECCYPCSLRPLLVRSNYTPAGTAVSFNKVVSRLLGWCAACWVFWFWWLHDCLPSTFIVTPDYWTKILVGQHAVFLLPMPSEFGFGRKSYSYTSNDRENHVGFIEDLYGICLAVLQYGINFWNVNGLLTHWNLIFTKMKHKVCWRIYSEHILNTEIVAIK